MLLLSLSSLIMTLKLQAIIVCRGRMKDFLDDGEKYQDLSWNNWFAAAANAAAAVAIDDSEKQNSAAM